jgi:hypothetical protein
LPEKPESKSIPVLANELRELVVTYARQETVEPAKRLGRYVAMGTAGSVVIAIGLGFLVFAGLRALQTETGNTFGGKLTWVPYTICAGSSLLIVAAAVAAIARGASRPRGGRG